MYRKMYSAVKVKGSCLSLSMIFILIIFFIQFSNPVVACKTLDDTHLGPWKGAPAGDLNEKSPSPGQYNHHPPPRPPPKFHYKPMYKSSAAAAVVAASS